MIFNELHYRHLLYAICLNSLSLVKAGSVCFSAATSLSKVIYDIPYPVNETIKHCSARLFNCSNRSWVPYEKFCEEFSTDPSSVEENCYDISAGSSNATDLARCIYSMLDHDFVKKESFLAIACIAPAIISLAIYYVSIRAGRFPRGEVAVAAPPAACTDVIGNGADITIAAPRALSDDEASDKTPLLSVQVAT